MTKITLKQRFGRAALVGLAGGLVAGAIMMSDGLFRHDYGFLRAASMGAFLAGLLLAGGFGGAGGAGWFRAGLSFGAATVLGAIFAVPLLGVDEWLMDTNLFRDITDLMRASLVGPVYVLSILGSTWIVLKVWLMFLILGQGWLIWGKPRSAGPGAPPEARHGSQPLNP